MKNKTLMQILAALAVLAAGIGIASLLASAKPEPEKVEREAVTVPVLVKAVVPESRSIKVIGQGTVKPAQELDLKAEVSGRVEEISPKLIPGGIVNEGEVLVRLDKRDYRVAVRQRQAQLEEAKANLKLEEGRHAVAKSEWDLIGGGDDITGARRDLVLRKPQLAHAKSLLASARSALSQANLNLARTVIKAPFNAIVKAEWVEVGTIVNAQAPIAKLIGADKYWVQMSIPMNQLVYIDLPDNNNVGGAKVHVKQEMGNGDSIECSGRIIRLLGDLETAGRMARLLIEIDDPLGLNPENSKQGLQLMIDAYVSVEIEGHKLDSVFVIERSQVHDGDEVWVMNKENRLEIRKVKIAWRQEKEVFVSEGLTPGDKVVTSNISTALEGTLLKDKGEKPPITEPDKASNEKTKPEMNSEKASDE